MRRFFTLFAVGVVALYAFVSWKGVAFGSTRKGLVIPRETMRSGGYRSYTYWRGGK